MIELSQLTKRYGSFLAVDNVSLAVERGNLFAFLGTNGAGKTTTIRMMTGVLRPTIGTIRIGGYDIQTHPIEAKSIMGVVPDRPYIYGKLTGREFLQFMADLYRVDPKLARVRISELLERYGLERAQHDLIDGYSHGMRQRLMMCAARIHNPQVLVVDEPMVGLDPPGAKLLKDTFRELTQAGTTVFMSTHSLSVAEELAHKLAIIKNGRIIAYGTLEDLYKEARTEDRDLEQVFLEIIERPEG
ncbi:ABC transporter ATP-binding protein [bacterium]|nr:ABC transporter ATP-binding protein [bacterium]